MKALVTGAGGFVGRFLVAGLIERGYSVRGMFLPGEDAAAAQKLGVEVFRGDLTKPESLAGAADGMDLVFHLAARVLDWGGMRLFERVMVGGTENLLSECRGKIGRFVYFSSVAALGLGWDINGLTEDAPRVTCGVPYCDTKGRAEDLVARFCSQAGIEHVVVRPANVIGPGSVWVSDVLDAYYRGPVPLIDGGRAPGAFVWVTNLVDGAIAAAESKDAAGKTYHFRDDYRITWEGYQRFLGGLIGKRPAGSIPFSVAWTLGGVLEAALSPVGIRPPITRLAAGVMGRNLDVDTTRAKKELGWTGKVGEAQAMAEIERWVREVYIPGRGRKR
ncbi:MAG: NAD-dependent epimerase/dehydratase family protein [Deltaproteobacteria bacterium]|nr:NAD-dependent epimerase/dehydratase family protein [Candidatus Zymogenaceae bacterium]